ncbi:MAG: ATP-binding protein, partial [Candidatus Cloacimonetes bacterium]|nr:ATP-binding protein [Candidatus Cloacimonadota bacterium]
KITALFAASNIGKEISFNKLKTMTGLTSATTIKEYFHYLENSYLVFLISRYDVSLKKQIYTNKKVYFIDTKLAEIIGFRFSEDKGRLLENVVFLQLKRMSKEIYFHKSKYECDFIIKEKNRINQAFQVTWNLNDENYKRETNGLLEAMEIYSMNSGTILTFAQEDEIELNGKYITMLPVWKWLLS